MKKLILLLMIVLMAGLVSAIESTTIFNETFNRPNSDTVGNGWKEIETAADRTRLLGHRLLLTHDFPVQSAIHNLSATGATNPPVTPSNITFKLQFNYNSWYFRASSNMTSVMELRFGSDAIPGDFGIRCWDGTTATTVGYMKTNTNFSFQLSAIDYALETYDLYIDGSFNTTCNFSSSSSNINSITFTTSPYNDGGSLYVDYVNVTEAESESPTFNHPTQTPQTNNSNIVFEATCPTTNIKLYFNNSGTIYTITNSSTTVNWGSNATSDGSYGYWAQCGTDANSSIRTWTYDTVSPDITLNPSNGFTTGNYSRVNQYNQDILDINITVTDDNDLDSFILNLTYTGISYFNFTNASLSGTSYTYTVSINTSTWPSNTRFDADIWSSDSHTLDEIEPYAIQKVNRNIDFNTAEGNNIRIETEEDATFSTEKKIDRYTIGVSFKNKEIKTRTFDIYSDNPIKYKPNSGYKAHFVVYGDNYQGNWLDFEGIAGTPKVTKISDYHYRVTFYNLPADMSFNSIGGLNINHVTYTWYKGSLTKTAVTSSSKNPITLTLNLTKDSSISNIDAGIIYNGTDYTINVTEVNATGYSYFVATFPGKNITGLTLAESFTYYWNITVIQADSYTYSFNESGSHTVTNFIMDNCTTITQTTGVFRIFDEDTLLALNATLEIDGSYWIDTGDTPKTFNLKFGSNATHHICIYPINITLYSDMYVKYTTLGFTHRWYIVNQTFNATSKNIDMYNFNNTVGKSDLKITVRRLDTYNFFSNIIGKLQRRYLSTGVWRTIQMDESGDYGLLFYNIIEETIDYRLIYLNRNNQILKTTESLKFICSSSLCEVTERLTPYSSVTASDAPILTQVFNNNTGLSTLSWLVTSGNSVNIRSIVTRETITGTAHICDSSASGAAGSIICNTTGYYGSYLLNVLQDGALIHTEYISAPREPLSNFLAAAEATLWTFAIMVTIIMFGAILGPVGAVLATLLGLIIIYFLDIFAPLTLGAVAVACVMGIAIAIKLRN